MSQQLLKKSLSLLENELDTRNGQTVKGKHKKPTTTKLKRKPQKGNQLKDATRRPPNKSSNNMNVFKDLHKHKVKYNLVKHLMIGKNSNQTNVSDKTQSVFTDKDFKDFALNYK